MEKQLYFIANQGCDATTYGIQEFTPEQLRFFCSIIRDLNQNSYYGCMPKIYLYKANWEAFKKIDKEDLHKLAWEDGYVDEDYRFWFNGECYTYKEDYFHYYTGFSEVNLEEVCNEE